MAYAYIPEANRKGKLSKKAQKLRLICYSLQSKGYRLINGDTKSLSVTALDAVRFLNDRWEAVSQQTIRNCWAKVGWKVEEVQEGGGNEQAPQPRQPQVVVQVPEGGVVVEEGDTHWRVHVDDEELQDVLQDEEAAAAFRNYVNVDTYVPVADDFNGFATPRPAH